MNSFIAEPSLTFTVDPNTTDDMLYMLEQALNAGAVVYIPEEESELILSSLKSKRFRISYLLAPLYGLPLRLGEQVSLSTILRASTDMDFDLSELPFVAGESHE
jgi:hypothetical protein